ncbi:MAG TPA: hypothetical protein VFM88_16550 [Vicinamibacteria bacterium]|nr:hypothetical protein [Vicinamibacteria bacterium]
MASQSSSDPDAFAIGVSHQELESALESGSLSSAREAIERILAATRRAAAAHAVTEAYQRLGEAIQSGPRRSSPILAAANLRRLMVQSTFFGARFRLGFWAGACRLAAARRNQTYFSSREAHRGWDVARADALPAAALAALDTAYRLLEDRPMTDAQWRRLEEAFRQFILVL